MTYLRVLVLATVSVCALQMTGGCSCIVSISGSSDEENGNQISVDSANSEGRDNQMSANLTNTVLLDSVGVLVPDSWESGIEENELAQLATSGVSAEQIRLLKPGAALGADSSIKVVPDVSGVYRQAFGYGNIADYKTVLEGQGNGVDVVSITIGGSEGFIYRYTPESAPTSVLIPYQNGKVLQINIDGVDYPTLDSVLDDIEIQEILSSITLPE
jgi:hypothetical protein